MIICLCILCVEWNNYEIKEEISGEAEQGAGGAIPPKKLSSMYN